MPKKLRLRTLTPDEQRELERISRSRTEAARRVERAQALLALDAGQRVAEVAETHRRSLLAIYQWLHRFNACGLAALDDAPRLGRPPTYSEMQRGELLAVAQTHPEKLNLPFGHWTLDRLVTYAHEQLHIPISRSQLGEILQAEGLRWYQEKTYFTERPDPQFAQKRGPS